MKKNFLVFFLPFFLFAGTAKCQSIPDSAEVALRFGSICCGPDSDQFLKEFYKAFNKGKCRKVKAYKAGGCGKEGEFFIFFDLGKLKNNRKQQFVEKLDALVTRENLKNKAEDSSSGGITLEYDQRIADHSYCRIPAERW